MSYIDRMREKRPDIDRIKSQIAMATPGPWTYGGYGNQVWQSLTNESSDPRYEHLPNAADRCIINEDLEKCDAVFIAYARTDIPNLLAYIEFLEQEIVLGMGRELIYKHGCSGCDKNTPNEEDEYVVYQSTPLPDRSKERRVFHKDCAPK